LLRAWASAAVDRDLLFCHPAVQPLPGDVLGDMRVVEFDALRRPEWGEKLAEGGLSMRPLSTVLRATGRPRPGSSASSGGAPRQP